jgi:hypothetical protein
MEAAVRVNETAINPDVLIILPKIILPNDKEPAAGTVKTHPGQYAACAGRDRYQAAI